MAWDPQDPGALPWSPVSPGAVAWAPEEPSAVAWGTDEPGPIGWTPLPPSQAEWGLAGFDPTENQTITGLWTFDRDPLAPFAVTSDSAVVENLDADLLDGQHGSHYLDWNNFTGVPATFPPSAHSSSHENDGSDEISVGGLSGLLADAQTPLGHAASHVGGQSDEVNHDTLLNYAVGQHRIINDAGTSSTELWSASKISTTVGLYLPLAGGTMAGDIYMGTNGIGRDNPILTFAAGATGLSTFTGGFTANNASMVQGSTIYSLDLIVQNTSVAAGGARVYITTNGTDDSWVGVQAGGEYWSAGIDRSDGFKYKIQNNFALDDTSKFELDTSGNLVLQGSGTFAGISTTYLGVGTATVPHGGVGGGIVAIEGADSNGTTGPHVQFTTAADDYPVMEILNFSHDFSGFLFDCYHNGTNFSSSDVGSNFAIFKAGDALTFGVNTGDIPGAAFPSFAAILSIAASGDISVNANDITSVGNCYGGDGMDVGISGGEKLTFNSAGTIVLSGAHVYLGDTAGNNVVAGNQAALATNATDGFLHIPMCAGVPTGAATAYTGKGAIVYDSTNDALYIREGGAWATVGGGGDFLPLAGGTMLGNILMDTTNEIQFHDSDIAMWASADSIFKIKADGYVQINGLFDLETTSSTTGQITQNGGTRILHTYGSSNLFVGTSAGNFTLSATSCVGIGPFALDSLTSGNHDVAVGQQTLQACTNGERNTAAGFQSQFTLTTGDDNCTYGYRTMLGGNGNKNSIMGCNACSSGSFGGSENAVLGYNVMSSATTSVRNCIVGSNSALLLSTGDIHTIVGYEAGVSLTTAEGCVMLGHRAGSKETGSYKLFIDSVGRSTEANGRVQALVYGEFNAATASQLLRINGVTEIREDSLMIGTAKWTFSDANKSIGWGGTNLDYLTDAGVHAFTPSIEVNAKAKVTAEGGFAVRLTNKTGANSVKGTVVEADGAVDDAFELAPADATDAIGVVYEDGIADGAECWIVWGGIADVLLKDGTAATRHYWVMVSDVAGRADATSAVPPGAVLAHFREIGHCVESVGSGTDVLARIAVHFN